MEHIVHPTDLSKAGANAFRHALRLAIRARAKLTILHVSKDGSDRKDRSFPHVRRYLEQWGMLPPHSTRDDVGQLGIAVRKLLLSGNDPVAACTEYMAGRRVDLLVLGTSQQESFLGLPHASVAERFVRECRVPSLVVPDECEGMVLRDGTLRLSSILIPVDDQPDPGAAVELARTWVNEHAEAPASITLLHAGNDNGIPTPVPPDTERHRWLTRTAEGDIVDLIARAAQATDLVVMATEGRNGLLDLVRGSTTERVLRRSTCPVLAVPAE